MAKPIKWEQWMFDLIADTKLTAKEIADQLGCTPHAVYQQRSKNGIRQWKKPRKHPPIFPKSKWPMSYKKARFWVLQRDNWICKYCGQPAMQVDHIIPKSHGGSDLPSNLVAACANCNWAKGNACSDCPRWQLG
jgi:5-methylcytosine-specific restriction endonuclease McrA